MTDARAVVARAVEEAAPFWPTYVSQQIASAALCAVSDAGFMIMPRDGLIQAAQRAEQAMRAWYEYQYNNKGTFDGKSERHDLVNAWHSLAAALKEMGAG